jgi:hypothetical protein
MHDTEALLRRVAELEQRLGVLEDIECIQRLQRMYGYYIDNRLWDEMTALFADADAAIEIAGAAVCRQGERRCVPARRAR